MSYKPEKGEIYQGKQVIIDSDRLLFNAKMDSILLYSNKAIGFSTMGSIHFDTSDQKESNESSNASKFVVNSPGLMDDILYNITYMYPTGPTGPMASNEANLSLRRTQVKDLRNNIKYIKSKITKLS